MKNLPEVTLSLAPLTHLLHTGIRHKLLLTAIELRVFSFLTRPTSAEALAREIKTHPENTRALLDALTANDLLDKKGGLYRNTPLADAFLVDGEPTYLGDVLADTAEWMQPALENMTALVKDGPPLSGSPPHSIPWVKEAEFRANQQRAGVAQHAASMVSRLPEFPHMKKMLDLGAGAGLIGLGIVAAHPTMNGVLFDQPEIVELAQRYIREYEMEDRVTTIGGDYMTDSIGEGYDLIWTSYTMTRENLDPLICKIHAALNPGGVYVSLAEGLSHERTKPAMFINEMLGVILTSHGNMLDEGEVAEAMLRAGFRSVHSRPADEPQPHGPAVIDIARK